MFADFLLQIINEYIKILFFIVKVHCPKRMELTLLDSCNILDILMKIH